jgi:hypothetical protein
LLITIFTHHTLITVAINNAFTADTISTPQAIGKTLFAMIIIATKTLSHEIGAFITNEGIATETFSEI